MHFGTGKSRDVLCRACRAARRDALVTTSATGATRTTRIQGRRHSVDWGGHVHLTCFQKLFLRLMQIQSTKDETCTRERYCFFVVRHVHVGTSTARHARQARRTRHDARDTCVSCRAVTQQAEYGLYTAFVLS